jgi:hypothetical protein
MSFTAGDTEALCITKADTPFEYRFMLRAKVLVGQFTGGNPFLRRPPEIRGQSHKLYDPFCRWSSLNCAAGDTEALCIVEVVGYGSGTVSLSVYINKYSG